ncbi:MAG TPA: hypothetical protein VFZ99_02330, partial [Terriglobales bacterium]
MQIIAVFGMLSSGSILFGQTPRAANTPPFKKSAQNQQSSRTPQVVKPGTKQFVLDVVKSAVGLSINDSQDRL